MRASLFWSLLLAGEYVVAQSLPTCAQACVGSTKTSCKSTDYTCACSDGKYLPKLTKCINKSCDEVAQAEAHDYLASLCAAVGHPIDNSTDPDTIQIELRANINVAARQVDTNISGFGDFTTFESTPRTRTSTSAPTGPVDNPAQTTAASSSGSSDADGGGGLSTGAKIGIGVGVPLGVGIIAGLVGLAFWLGRKSKKEQAATTNPQQPQMAGPMGPYPPPALMGPAELDQSAQYIGHEMPTKVNTAEMPAASPPPKEYAQPQHGYVWPQQGQQQSVQQHPQQLSQQYPQQGQTQYPPPGQQWPQQGQQYPATELPERR